VIEAGERGGALITARLGFDQNREVFAIPGSLEMPYSAGCNNLIRDNVAKLVTGPEDVLIELGLDQPAQSQAQQQAGRQLALQQPATNGNSSSNSPPAPGQERPKYKPVTVSLSAPEQKVLNQLEQEPALLDQLVERTGISAGELMSILLTLEFKGLVQQLPGRKFIRC
jgi:DNA processing protein